MSKSALIIVDMVRDFTDRASSTIHKTGKSYHKSGKCWINAGKKGYWSYLCNIAIEKEKWTEKPRQ